MPVLPAVLYQNVDKGFLAVLDEVGVFAGGHAEKLVQGVSGVVGMPVFCVVIHGVRLYGAVYTGGEERGIEYR